jgi:predicted  nucleic acid-binding Zn-ribbon protein
MIHECEKCGTKYNDDTVDKCPACSFAKRRKKAIENQKSEKHREKYRMREEIYRFRSNEKKEKMYGVWGSRAGGGGLRNESKNK